MLAVLSAYQSPGLFRPDLYYIRAFVRMVFYSLLSNACFKMQSSI